MIFYMMVQLFLNDRLRTYSRATEWTGCEVDNKISPQTQSRNIGRTVRWVVVRDDVGTGARVARRNGVGVWAWGDPRTDGHQDALTRQKPYCLPRTTNTTIFFRLSTELCGNVHWWKELTSALFTIVPVSGSAEPSNPILSGQLSLWALWVIGESI